MKYAINTQVCKVLDLDSHSISDQMNSYFSISYY